MIECLKQSFEEKMGPQLVKKICYILWKTKFQYCTHKHKSCTRFQFRYSCCMFL